MNILFAGTPDFAAAALATLLQSEHRLIGVLTQPDRRSGRGMQLSASPVKRLALQHGIPVLQPDSLKGDVIQQELRALQPDVMVVAAYGLILPPAVLQLPRHGCLNIHASLLPRWRGAAPIQRAILADDRQTGITIMQMDAGLDTGDIVLQQACPISSEDNAQTLHDKLASLGADCIVRALQRLANGPLRAQPQDAGQSSYAAKLSKAEAWLEWNRSAAELERAVRAYNPFPVACGELNGTAIKIWRTRRGSGKGIPGTVLGMDKSGIEVACAEGSLWLEILQKPGGKPLPAAQFVQGFGLSVGNRFGKGAA
ncbi:MAG: methionyl-tRNA formyltransferase [Gallionella sp.]|nr:methionyl-tRNA formyltransferase [Gallionella sp.]PIR09419.1 MAG: methionyl-tRNA formyltransferase [Gallionellaceae bacterium CG11_big_fil_rev_8_21_14_0_20_60_62]PIY06601.1 MAG: methionyl-tRNA formyltransferase [Gallionellaceae bacterium CG_4_10_14_3_um_filter_60_1069]PJC04679.1 MAG: methionyl-tRNA formyltransferase [Gallionellaceae bacterium CG_4_9_14_0_8_um_filter_60_335]NCP79861.1 methionyl-tRNA formyltransferase [Gallionella sp.]